MKTEEHMFLNPIGTSPFVISSLTTSVSEVKLGIRLKFFTLVCVYRRVPSPKGRTSMKVMESIFITGNIS